MSSSSISSLSRNKMTTVQAAKRSSVSSVLSGASSKTSKLRSELRRVMSDRVMKITRSSQQQNVEKVKRVKDNLLNSSSLNFSQNRIALASQSQLSNDHTAKLKTSGSSKQLHTATVDRIKSPDLGNRIAGPEFTNKLIAKETSPKFLAKMTGNTTTRISPNAKLSNKISLQPIKTFDLKDMKSLIDHILSSYNDAIKTECSIILTVQSIINSITHYIEANQLDLKTSLDEILKENLFKTSIQLRQKYSDDEQSEKLKLEGQIQVLLQIENYIISNMTANSNKVKVDDDWVWDIANSIRWLKQKFKDFKIERFLFGEIYANYSLTAPDFISSLMEELGYDKEDNASGSSSESESPTKTPVKGIGSQIGEMSEQGRLKTSSSSAKFLSQLSQSQSTSVQINGIFKEESNSSYSFIGGVNSLFEEEDTRTQTNDGIEQNEDDCSQHPTSEKADILDEFIKKKPVNKNASFSQSSMRSIVIQKKRTRLKIRSPFKSPSKSLHSKQNRRSPRIKDKQILSTDTQKRPRSYLITDTPDHKQNATIITTRQEKLRKRFSFQQFSNASNSPSVLPSVPDTPVKGETIEPPSIAVRNGSLFPFQKIYPSPSKAYMSPQKIYASPNKIYITPQKVYGSPLKVYATPSPSKRIPSSPSPSKFVVTASPSHIFASPQHNYASPAKKSPAKRVIFR